MTNTLVVVHESHAGLGRLGDLAGLTIDLRRPDQGDPLPTTLTDHDALIVLGGSMAAWQDDVAPWLPATRHLLAEAVATGVPTLGVCLGAQLLALAGGGTVARGDHGLEVGLASIEVTPQALTDPFFGVLADLVGRQFDAVQWHQDAIMALPAQAVVMATGSQYPHQGFRLGDAAWGVQYHPEVTATDWADWLRAYDPGEHLDGFSADMVDAPVQAAQEQLTALAAAHVTAFRAAIARTTTTEGVA